jgi:hypothetical protein
MQRGKILDLCGGSGSWSKPWADAGYEVVIVDAGSGDDVRTYTPPDNVLGVLAGSGARWWADKPETLLIEAVEIVRACLDIIQTAKPAWWALENPVGRLARVVPELGRFSYTFQPWEYGDPYTKRTCIWGSAIRPTRNPVEPTEGGKIWRMAPSPERAALRSVTPQGFAKAFYEANRGRT